MSGIDYGLGMTNIDTETGIRFGVIPSNDIMSEAFDDIASNGTDLDFEAYKERLTSELGAAISCVLDDNGLDRCNDAAAMAEEIVDNLEWDDYEGTGDCARYEYEADGYKLRTCSDGDIFVLKSPYYTFAPFCSPCAPGAGYLRDGSDDDSNPKTYCLGKDWFSDDYSCPYAVFDVKTDECLYRPAETEE